MFGSLTTFLARLCLRRAAFVVALVALVGWSVLLPIFQAQAGSWHRLNSNALRAYALALKAYNEYPGTQCEEPPCPECEANKEAANSDDADDEKDDGDRGGGGGYGRDTVPGRQKGSGDRPITTDRPVHLRHGAALELEVDLRFPGPAFGWQHARSYDTFLTATSVGELDGLANGYRWESSARMPLVNNLSGTAIELFLNASSKRTFTYLNESPTGVFNYSPPKDYHATLTKKNAGTSSEICTLTELDTGNVYVFYGFDTLVSAQYRGRLKERTTREYQAQGKTGVTFDTYNADGLVTEITLANGWFVDYTYYSAGTEAGRLQKVEMFDGSVNLQQKVEYTYQGNVTSPHADLGAAGDLVQVKVSMLASNGTDWLEKYTQYRYFTGTDLEHHLKSVYESDAIQRINGAGNSAADTPEELLTKADSYTVTGSTALSAYASRTFTYYNSNLDTSANVATPWVPAGENLQTKYGGNNINEVDSEWPYLMGGLVKTETVNAGCASCGGGGTGGGITRTYFYLGQEAGIEADKIFRIVVEDTEKSDGAEAHRQLYGLNYTGNALRQARIENPTAGTLVAWCRSKKIDATDLYVSERRSPAAHSLIDTNTELAKFLNPNTGTNDTDTLNASDGAIRVYEVDAQKIQVTGVKVKKGRTGTAYYVNATDYGDGTNDKPIWAVTGRYRYPTATTTRTAGKKTSYTYTFWDAGDTQLQSVTVTEPSIATGQNGSGTATTRSSHYDKLGRLRWTKDGETYVNYYSYHADLGTFSYAGIDVNPSSMPSSATSNTPYSESSNEDGDGNGTYDAAGKPSRGGSLPTALALVTMRRHDALSREYQSTDPRGTLHFTLFEASGTNARRLYFPYWDGTSKPLLPIEAIVVNDAGQPLESYTIDPDRANGSASSVSGLTAGTGQSHYLSWTKYSYTTPKGQLEFVDRYHDVPTSGNGTLTTNFHRSVLKYDTMGRQQYSIQVVSGTATSSSVEQVTQNVYDVMDRVIETKQGASSTSHDMTSTYTTYPTLVTISKTVYDGGLVGNGYVTKTSRYFGTGTYDFTSTQIGRTYRGHVRYIRPTYQVTSTETDIGPFTVMDVDWMGRTKATALYDAAPTWATVLTGDGYTDYASGTTTDRRSLSKTLYDDQGRVYQTEQYEVAESNGAAGNKFVSDNFYDREWRLVGTRQQNGAGREMAYDGAGRQYESRLVTDLETTKYTSGAFNYRDPLPKPDIANLSGGNDGVIELSHTAFDAAGNELESHHFELDHDDTNGLSLTSNDYVRRSVFSWYDAADRVTATGDYGSGDTTAGQGTWKYVARPTRAGSAPSTSADTVLLTKYGYHVDTGRLELVTHPDATQTKTFYDDLGRTRHVAENYANFDPATPSTSGDATDKSKDRVTETQYNGLSQVVKLIAQDQNGDGTHTDDETTTYLYESTVNAAWVTNEIYPDSSDTTSAGTDQIKFTYNTDGSVATRTDQLGTVLTYVYYSSHRKLKAQKAGTLGSGVDTSFRSITYGYDNMQRRQKVTSHPNVTDNPDASMVMNQVYFAYDDMGALITRWQDNGGEAVTSGMSQSPKVQFAYDTSATSSIFTNGRRLKQVTYPNGRIVHYTYGTAGAVDDLLHRVQQINEDSGGSPGAVLELYSYNGAGRMAIADAQQVNLKLNYFTSTANYGGWDRFGRVKDQFWDGYTDGTTTADVDRFKYEYDYAGNPKFRDIDAAIYATNTKDQAWTYDGLERLKTFDKGTLSGTTITGTPAREQDWTLDALGNWSGLVVKTSGTTNLNQSRTHNVVNEITGITASTGDNWYDPTYDAAGNMATGPKPSAPKDSDANGRKFKYTYDAWQRLVKVEESPTNTTTWTTVNSYEYNGLNERTYKNDIAASPDVNYNYYYNHQWQVVEVRKNGDTDPLEQWVWHKYHVDAPAIRYYDDNVDGASIATQYFTHDANFNITALVNSSGTVQERYEYDPYGMTTVLDASFANDADGVSDYLNPITYCGYRADAETGLYQVRHRYLDPGLGRWVTRDPIGYGGGENLYEYCLGDPLTWTDALGAKPGDCVVEIQDTKQRSVSTGRVPLPRGWAGSLTLTYSSNSMTTRCEVCCADGSAGQEVDVQFRAIFGVNLWAQKKWGLIELGDKSLRARLLQFGVIATLTADFDVSHDLHFSYSTCPGARRIAPRRSCSTARTQIAADVTALSQTPGLRAEASLVGSAALKAKLCATVNPDGSITVDQPKFEWQGFNFGYQVTWTGPLGQWSSGKTWKLF